MHWLLNHNAALRPSSAELLQSPYLPPPQLEEAELHEMVGGVSFFSQHRHLIESIAVESRIRAASSHFVIGDLHLNLDPTWTLDWTLD